LVPSVGLALTFALFAAHALAAVFALRAVQVARTPQGATAWVLFLLVLPWIAIPVFLVFGDFRYHGMVRDRRLSESESRRLHGETAPSVERSGDALHCGFETLAGRAAIGGARVALLRDGAAFGALFAALEEARETISIETYILRADGVGDALAKRLVEKARHGVTVRLLYDPFGSLGLAAEFIDRLKSGGVAIAPFHGRRRRLFEGLRVNFRDHRKTAVIDGETGFTGGFNFGDEYLGLNPKIGAWRDTMIRLDGPIVAQMHMHFGEDWHWATGETLQLSRCEAARGGAVDGLILASGPADARETGTLYFLHAISSARKRIWIASPYFSPDEGLCAALRMAAARGVDVRIVMADRRDHWLVWLAGFATMEHMRGSGVRIYRYLPGFMHQKIVLVDEAMASVGSHNLDSRSCGLNFEISALLFDTDFARQIAAMLEQDMAVSSVEHPPLAGRPAYIRLGAPFARLLTPIL
jgi:cardiolipin synthase